MKFLFLLCAYATADVYMHNPRGSNDRNCEKNVNRNNGNLLFDSQNNAKGGYACGRKIGGNAPDDQTPQMEFWEGSKLAIKWTAQHGTGALDSPTIGKPEDTSDSEIIIQYACSDTLDPTGKYNPQQQGSEYQGTPRDGIPQNANDDATDRPGTDDDRGDNNADAYQDPTQNRFSIHETAEAYNDCNRVSRNKGLFTADQNVNRRSAIGTRQNPNGGRRGLECPEERDYYPYWRPSPFVDIAALVTDSTRCGNVNMAVGEWCQACAAGIPCPNACTNTDPTYTDTVVASQNVDPKGFCLLQYDNNQVQKAPTADGTTDPNGIATVYTTDGRTRLQAAQRAYQRREWPISQAVCNDIGQQWVTGKFSRHNLVGGTGPAQQNVGTNNDAKAVVCKKSEFSRPNHLGNGQQSVTTVDAPPGNGKESIEVGYAAQANTYVWTLPTFTGAQHTQYDKVGNNQAQAMPCVVRLRYNMSSSDFARTLNSDANGKDNSPITQDPYIDIGNDDTPGTLGNADNTQLLSLAVNTNQYARTFQDRSYVFKVRAVKGAANIAAMGAGGDCENGVWNMNVQGKRGNIVQTYPSVEYNWVPQSVCVAAKTCLHFQVTGSDYNPRRGCNDGEGGPPDRNNNAASNQNARADRSNLVEQANFMDQYPLTVKDQNKIAGSAQKLNIEAGVGNVKSFFKDKRQAYRFAFLDQEAQLRGRSINPVTAQNAVGEATDDMWEGATYFFARNEARTACLTQNQLNNLNAGNQRETHPRNCAKLNAAMQPYQNQGIVKISTADGTHALGDKYALYSTRNNNFSNREQSLAISIGTMTDNGFNCAGASTTNADPTTPRGPVIDLDAEPAIAQSEFEAYLDSVANLEGEALDPIENDGTGDGIAEGCSSKKGFGMSGTNSQTQVSLAFTFTLMVSSMIFLH